MPKTQLNAFKSMFLILISNNLLIYKIDQINQISIFSFYFSTFFRKAFPHDLFCPFSSAIYFRITYLSHAASAGDLPLKCQTFHYGSRPFCSHVAMLQDGASLGAYFVNKLALPLVDFKMNVIKWKLHFVSCNFGLKSNL